MTLLLDAGNDGPRVHILGIAVGAYRHVPGGVDPHPQTLVQDQLTSPVPSLEAFLTWCAQTMKHPTAKLGTIEALSAPTNISVAGTQHAVDLPNLDNVRTAFTAWYDRCNASNDNVAIFYFCGHGVEKDAQYLLLEDYAANPLSLLERSVDFDALCSGMARCAARSQYFFADACRAIPFDLLQYATGGGQVLIDPMLTGDPRTNLGILRATRFGKAAFALPSGPTLFTGALMRALGGLGSRPHGTRWQVTHSRVGEAVGFILRNQPREQQPTSGGSGECVLHVLDKSPMVPVRVAWDPCQPSDQVSIDLQGHGPNATSYSDHADGPWSREVAADTYSVAIEFMNNAHGPVHDSMIAFPPDGSECIATVV
jgi:hypothetical protein